MQLRGTAPQLVGSRLTETQPLQVKGCAGWCSPAQLQTGRAALSQLGVGSQPESPSQAYGVASSTSEQAGTGPV